MCKTIVGCSSRMAVCALHTLTLVLVWQGVACSGGHRAGVERGTSVIHWRLPRRTAADSNATEVNETAVKLSKREALKEAKRTSTATAKPKKKPAQLDGRSKGKSHGKVHGEQAARPLTKNPVTSDVAPVLLGFEPDSGPRDGGTWVRIIALGLNESANLSVLLRGVKRKGNVVNAPEAVAHVERTDEGLFFRTPNMTNVAAVEAGLLVSIDYTKEVLRRAKHTQWARLVPIAGPIFFRILPPLRTHAPAWVNPCCDFKLSGGEVLTLSGAHGTAPASRAIVRFRGFEHEHEVEGQVVQAEWGVASVAEDAPDQAWHVYTVTPPWPHEDDVSLDISWNRQQFASYKSTVRFVEEKSVFGSMAGRISEDHLANAAEGDAAAEGRQQETVSIVQKEAAPGQEVEKTEMSLVDKAGDSFILSRSGDLTHLQEDLRLIHDIFTLTCAAFVGGALVHNLGAPTIIGCLMGGIAVGPGGFDVVEELVQIESMAELGVCLLLFCIGLELTWAELLANTRAAFAGLLAIVLLCGFVVLLAAFLLKTPVSEALCVGLFAALSSTPVSLRAIRPASKEEGESSQNESSVLLAILVTQDIVLAALLAGMPFLFRRSSSDVTFPSHSMPPTPAPTNTSVGVAGLARLAKGELAAGGPWRYALLGVVTTPVICGVLCRRQCRRRNGTTASSGSWWLLDKVQQMDDAFFTVSVLSYSFLAAFLTDWVGLSAELGAFVAGLMLQSVSPELAHRTELRLGGLKDTFVAWFFASIGLVVNPHFLLDNLRAILTVVMLVFVLKLITGFVPLWLLSRRDSPSPALAAMRTSWILAHISEFGFVLASKGTGWRVLSRHVYLLLVGANAVSLCCAPGLFRMRDCLLPEEGPMSSTITDFVGEDDAALRDDEPPPRQAGARSRIPKNMRSGGGSPVHNSEPHELASPDAEAQTYGRSYI